MARFIRKNELNKEVRTYLETQDKAIPFFEKMKKDSNEFNYYNNNEISFYFEKAWVEFLLSKPGANCLRVYYGARTNGKPTLILVAASLDITKKTLSNIFLNSEDGGVEWPDGTPPPPPPPPPNVIEGHGKSSTIPDISDVFDISNDVYVFDEELPG